MRTAHTTNYMLPWKQRRLRYHVLRPFSNLLPGQQVLQLVRLGSAFVAVCLMVVLLGMRTSPTKSYLARINCSHLDVAYGLYKSLRSSISLSYVGNLLATLSLTDSEIAILTEYTQNQVASAPQYILLGYTQWCRVDYATDYAAWVVEHTNVTTVCLLYLLFNMFDYQSALLDNSLTIILAYAYELGYDNDSAYTLRVLARNKRFHITNVVLIVLLALQVVLLLAGFIVYSNRGPARNLLTIPKVTLNAIAVVSLLTALCMVNVVIFMYNDFLTTKKEIASGIGLFGITMSLGSVYFSLLFLAFGFTCLSMLSWVVPLWCANPPDDGYASDEEFHTTRDETHIDELLPFVVKPYNALRQTRSDARLVDDPPRRHTTEMLQLSHGIKNPFTDTMDLLVLENMDSVPPMTELSSKVHSEWELRKLGEKMSRSVSVRRLNRAKPVRPQNYLVPEKKDTRSLLYTDTSFSNHQYPQALPKSMDAGELSRAASLTFDTKLSRTRNLLHRETSTDLSRAASVSSDAPPKGLNIRAPAVEKPTSAFLGVPENNSDNNSDSNISADDAVSVLNEDEMKYLDNNNFVNYLP